MREYFPHGIFNADLDGFREKERLGRKLGFSVGRYGWGEYIQGEDFFKDGLSCQDKRCCSSSGLSVVEE